MRRELFFLNGSQDCEMFRPNDLKYTEHKLTEDGIKDVSTGSGVYIICSEDGTKFVYPKGQSSVIYIGKSDDSLRGRLRQHLKHLKECEEDNSGEGTWLMRYEYMKAFGAKVFVIRTKGTQKAKNLEAQILWMFYCKYRSLPVGNGARSFDNRP